MVGYNLELPSARLLRWDRRDRDVAAVRCGLPAQPPLILSVVERAVSTSRTEFRVGARCRDRNLDLALSARLHQQAIALVPPLREVERVLLGLSHIVGDGLEPASRNVFG